jgi:TRAP-type mannitol/chloroaromatic compound transport system permease small subunit
VRKLSFLLHIIDAISEWVGKITSFIIILMIGVVILNVVMRYVFNSAAPWQHISACGKLLPAYVILGGAYVLLTKAHINIDIFYRRFPLRMRGIADLVTSTLFFLFCIALLWKAVEAGANLHHPDRPFFPLPSSWLVLVTMPIGASLLLLQGLAKFIRDLIIAISGKEIA